MIKKNQSRSAKYSERNKRTGLKRRAKMRARLLDAAMRVMLDRGVEAPVIDDFITAAEVSRGSFYYYFRTKEELVEAVIEHLGNELSRLYDAAKQSMPDPAERLVGGVRFLIGGAAEHRQWTLLLQPMPGKDAKSDNLFRRGPKADLKVCINAGILPNQNIDTAIDMFIGTTSRSDPHREHTQAAQGLPGADRDDDSHGTGNGSQQGRGSGTASPAD